MSSDRSPTESLSDHFIHRRRRRGRRHHLHSPLRDIFISSLSPTISFNDFSSDSDSNLLLHPSNGSNTIIPEMVAPPVRNVGMFRVQDTNGLTALMHAALRGHLSIVQMLVGYEGLMVDLSGRTALYHALENNNMEVATFLIPYEDPTDQLGRTALMRAADKGNTSLVKLLSSLQSGMRTTSEEVLGTITTSGRTALMGAAANGHIEAVKALLCHEGKLHDDRGQTAFMFAIAKGHKNIARLLMEYEFIESEDNALIYAALLDDAKLASAHLEKCRGRDTRGQTALMCAAEFNNRKVVKLLIKYERGIVDEYDNTALMIAAYKGYTRVVKALYKYEYLKSRWNPLIYAAYTGKFNLVKRNIKYQKCSDNHGMTALMWAARRGFTRIVKLLAQYEIGIQDQNGWTALMHATSAQKGTVIDLLIPEARLQTTVTHNGHCAGSTALMIAIRTCQDDVVEKLFRYEKGIFTPLNDCALILSMQLDKAKYISLTMNEIYVRSASDCLCLDRIRELYKQKSNQNFKKVYNIFKHRFISTIFSNITDGGLHRLLLATAAFIKDHTTTDDMEGIDLVWSALLCEFDHAFLSLDEYLLCVEDNTEDGVCALCMSSLADNVLLPCKHLVACSVCLNMLNSGNTLNRCPCCRADVDSILTISTHLVNV